MKLVYDFTLGRPGCALLQATFGSDNTMVNGFDSESWLVFPTPDMGMYELDTDKYTFLMRVTELVMNGLTVEDARLKVIEERNEATR